MQREFIPLRSGRDGYGLRTLQAPARQGPFESTLQQHAAKGLGSRTRRGRKRTELKCCGFEVGV